MLPASHSRFDIHRFTLCDTLTSPFMPVMDPIFPLPVLPGVKKLTTEAGVAVPAQPRAEATPALPPLVLQTALQLLPPPRLFFLRLAPRLASVGLIFFTKGPRQLAVQNGQGLRWNAGRNHSGINPE